MKKGLLLLLVLVLALNAAYAEDGWNVLDKANRVSLALRTYGSVGIRHVYYGNGGIEIYDEFSWITTDENGQAIIAYEDSDGNVEITMDGVCVGYDALENSLYSARFLLDEYENCVSGVLDGFFYLLTGEEIVSEPVTADGVTSITSVYLDGNGFRFTTHFLLDAETGFMKEYSEWFANENANEEDELICRSTVIPNAQYEIPDELLAILHPEKTRTVTVVMDTGETQDFQTSADAQFLLFVPEGYAVYSDAEMTEIFYEEWPEDDEFPAETTVYFGRMAGEGL